MPFQHVLKVKNLAKISFNRKKWLINQVGVLGTVHEKSKCLITRVCLMNYGMTITIMMITFYKSKKYLKSKNQTFSPLGHLQLECLERIKVGGVPGTIMENWKI